MRRRLICYSVLTLFIVAGLATFATITNVSEHHDTQRYIIQANSLEQAIALVRDVGGEITHELGIIHSVGANLSLAQLNALRDTVGVRRVYVDHSVTINDALAGSAPVEEPGCTLSANSELKFDDDELFWYVTNTSNIDVHLDKMTIIWPASNERLEEVEFGDLEIFDGTIYGVSAAFDISDSNVAANDDRLTIGSFTKPDRKRC